VGHAGDLGCSSAGGYTDAHLFYAGVDDARACTACSCGPVSGSACSTTVTLYADGACSTVVQSGAAGCYDVPAGTPIGSKSANPPVYQPGFCGPSGGEPTGDAIPQTPFTFCCLP